MLNFQTMNIATCFTIRNHYLDVFLFTNLPMFNTCHFWDIQKTFVWCVKIKRNITAFTICAKIAAPNKKIAFLSVCVPGHSNNRWLLKKRKRLQKILIYLQIHYVKSVLALKIISAQMDYAINVAQSKL